MWLTCPLEKYRCVRSWIGETAHRLRQLPMGEAFYVRKPHTKQVSTAEE